MVENNNRLAATTNQNLYNEKNLDNTDWLDNTFNILNDDDDEDDKEDPENILEQYNHDFDFNCLVTNLSEEEMIIKDDSVVKNVHDSKMLVEEILSQKLSQLSSNGENDEGEYSINNKKRHLSTPATPDVVSKKIRVWDEDDNENDEVPEYLQGTNTIFAKKMTADLINSATALTVEDLCQLAVLKHKIMVTNLDKELWNVYLKSGTGQWKTQESVGTNVDRRFWPIQVKRMTTPLPNLIDTNKRMDEQHMHENVVNKHLQELDKTMEQYLQQFDDKKNDLMGLTDAMEKTIETYIQQYGIFPLQMKLNYKIAILQYDYDAQLLEREYLRLNPTDEQIQVAQRLYDLKCDHLQSKQELIELKKRLLCNKPTKLMNSIIEAPVNEKAGQVLSDQQEKEIQAKLTDLMAASTTELETKIHGCRTIFNEQILQVSANSNNKKERLPENLVDLINRRFDIIEKKLKCIYNFKMKNLLRSRYGHLQDKFSKTATGFSPTMIIDTASHQFTNQQLKLLNRGPSYVPPCQMYVSSDTSIHDITEKLYKLLQHHLSIVYEKHGVNMSQRMFISKEIKEKFTATFSSPLPEPIHQRALYEQQLVQSIREHLKMNHLILRRTADQKNVFYLGNAKEFHQKACDYLIETDAFEVSATIDDNNPQQTQDYFIKMIRSMNLELERIFSNKKFYKDLLNNLLIEMVKVEIPYSYFLPDVSKREALSVEPIIASRRSATAQLGKFLDALLRPVIQRQSKSTAFANGADFIRKLIQYSNEEHRLRPTTIFTTMTISNYDTVASHKAMLTVLEGFLHDHLVDPAIERVPVKTIINLTALFLNNNRFYYDNKIYRYTKGGPKSLSLCETLSDIYVFQWQNILLREPLVRMELFGRCKNQIFFTWNETISTFRALLKTIGSHEPKVQLETVMGLNTQFLDAHIENRNGTLYSRVYHDSNSQKYTLPYVIGHAKVAHSHWLRSALIRAVRYCTSVDDFNQERIYLELTCLANGYSLEFVEHRVSHFFTHFDATSLRLSLDQRVYDKFRHRLFNFISEQQQVVDTNRQLEEKNQRLRLTYGYQFGSTYQFNKKLKDTLLDYLNKNDPVSRKKMKIILTTQQQHSLNALLSQQKPSHSILKNTKTIF